MRIGPGGVENIVAFGGILWANYLIHNYSVDCKL